MNATMAAEHVPLQLVEDQPRAQAATVLPIAAATPGQLLQLAAQSGASIDQLERLMAMQERWEANEARKAFVQGMSDFKAEPLDIFKRKRVSFTTRDGDTTTYNHAELSDVVEVVVPAMARHHLSHRWAVKQSDGRIHVTCFVTHRAGHTESVEMDAAPDASGKKNAIQQVASAITYMQRYTLLAVCGLATKDVNRDDDGKGSGDPVDGQDLVPSELLAGLQATKEDGEARSYWLAKRDALRDDKPVYDAFKRAVIDHRSALRKGDKQ